eukprot:SAG22_NODE_11653_length_475_cov_1.313830_1_plen_80_part_01
MRDITTVFEAHATQIESEKLKAIGLRNLIDMQKEKMRRKEREVRRAGREAGTRGGGEMGAQALGICLWGTGGEDRGSQGH